VTWFKPWDKVLDWDFTKGHIRWFEGGKLNVSYNCLDRHLATRGDQVAIIWEGDSPRRQEDHLPATAQDVCKFANALKSLGVKKGDRVCIYMPMIPETAVAMLACTRIGAVHSIVFGGFSPDSLKDRIIDAECKLVVTSDEGSARRAQGADEGQCRQGAVEHPQRHRRWWWSSAPAARRLGPQAATSGITN
jgi:acetyl-CoA synthetase